MSVGTTLTEARERAGMTLTQVADQTMIRRTLVENIEADDYHACGGEFYARMHIKSIAHAVGLDAAPLLAEFDREHAPPDAPTATGVLDSTATAAAVHDADRRRPNWTLAMAAALAAVLAFGGFQLLTGGDNQGTTTGVAAPAPTASSGDDSGTSDEQSEPTASSSTESEGTPSDVPSDAIAAASGVTVVLNATDGRSWVSATGKDSGVLFQNVLNTGREQTFRDDRQVKLVVGNAGAVRLVVNGRDLGSPGGEGEVVRLTFGPGDPTLAGG